MLKSKIIFTIAISLIIVMKSSLAFSRNEYKRIPLRWEDVYIISQKFDIPFAVMITVLHQEDGYVGLKRKNDNGTYDYGPFQINSIHLQSREFKSAGITKEQLQYDGRVNALAAAYYLRKVGVSNDMDKILDTIARYHSFTPECKARYKKDFLVRMRSYKNVASTIERANRGESDAE